MQKCNRKGLPCNQRVTGGSSLRPSKHVTVTWLHRLHAFLPCACAHMRGSEPCNPCNRVTGGLFPVYGAAHPVTRRLHAGMS